MKPNLDFLCSLAHGAGQAILDIYGQDDFQVEYKEDRSPLTVADRKSHDIIEKGLREKYPDIPVLSEESKEFSYEKRKNWRTFWLVDPLDGTKEFIKRNGEFTVNIALIQGNRPVLGVIYAPVLDWLYYGIREDKAYKKEADGSYQVIQADSHAAQGLVSIGSRSHASEEETALFEKNGVKETIRIGSSLKFCMVAEGKAHLYYRHNPTMEWDTAAGQMIAEAAGAVVEGLTYNKPVLRNGSFLVRSVDIQR